jgi:hypothetical protein
LNIFGAILAIFVNFRQFRVNFWFFSRFSDIFEIFDFFQNLYFGGQF